MKIGETAASKAEAAKSNRRTIAFRVAQRLWKALPLPSVLRSAVRQRLYVVSPPAAVVATPDLAAQVEKTLPPRPLHKIRPGRFVLSGYLSDVSGIGRAGRMSLAAFRAAGLAPNPHDLRAAPLGWGDTPAGGVWFAHCNAPEAKAFLMQSSAAHACYRIGYWAWELPELPPAWTETAALFHEIWTPSTFVATAVRKATAGLRVQVKCVPHPFPYPVVSDVVANRARFGINADAFAFLCMYDVLSSATRKNPGGAITAFQRAFAPDRTDVQLVVKVVVDAAHDNQLSALQDHICAWPNITMIAERLSDSEADALIASADAFVSLHRSEGFGLSIAQAMALARPVIVTGWSGNMDFCDEGALRVRYTLRAVDDPSGVYHAPEQVWADPSITEAAAAMQTLVSDPEAARRIGETGRAHIAKCLPRQYDLDHLRRWLD